MTNTDFQITNNLFALLTVRLQAPVRRRIF